MAVISLTLERKKAFSWPHFFPSPPLPTSSFCNKTPWKNSLPYPLVSSPPPPTLCLTHTNYASLQCCRNCPCLCQWSPLCKIQKIISLTLHPTWPAISTWPIWSLSPWNTFFPWFPGLDNPLRSPLLLQWPHLPASFAGFSTSSRTVRARAPQGSVLVLSFPMYSYLLGDLIQSHSFSFSQSFKYQVNHPRVPP